MLKFAQHLMDEMNRLERRIAQLTAELNMHSSARERIAALLEHYQSEIPALPKWELKINDANVYTIKGSDDAGLPG